jgi:2-polyprenyl-3-methyl-5-hydroxy-6-metoxy-1,4-benzoquinol methylase
VHQSISRTAKVNALKDTLRQGHYFRKQVLSSNRLISWAHRRRYEIGMSFASQFAGKHVLDYGCGDGTFLTLLMASPSPPTTAIGTEESRDLVEDCNRRLRCLTNLRFMLSSELQRPEHQGAYDGIICMEVLEHVTNPDAHLDDFVDLLAPSGQLVISVPVETGFPLLLKQTVRRVAGWRNIGDYPGVTPYTFKELLSGFLAGRIQHIVRPVHRTSVGSSFHDHKGFNWMVLRDLVAQRFNIEKTLTSPLPWITPCLSSQVWFVAVKKP